MKGRIRSSNLIHQLNNETYRCNRWDSNRSKYFQFRFDTSTKLYCQDSKGHSGCVNALDFSSDGFLLASGGDDKRVLIWNIAETLFSETNRSPTALHATHLSNIFSVKFDNQNRRIISAGNDEQILVHDIEKQNQRLNSTQCDDLVDVFLESSPINCLSIQPQEDNIFIAATEDGHIHLYDCRVGLTSVNHDQPTIVVAESFDGSFHSCTFHPQQTCLVATANARQGIELYDIRLSKSSVLRYGATNRSLSNNPDSSTNNDIEGMSVTFNSNGSLLYALRRRLPPVLFKLHQSRAFCQFDADNYVNLCTMKAGCFLGDEDQYIASGSDDFNVYIWRIPDHEDYQTLETRSMSHLYSDNFVWSAHMILPGHRSVVNQVRYSSRLHTLVSSGVEKIIKMWTPYQTRNQHQISHGYVGREEMYSHRDYLRALLESGSVHHDSSTERYDEDRRMLAFFDSLLQRELAMDHEENYDIDGESDTLSSVLDSSDDDDSDEYEDSIRTTQSEDHDDVESAENSVHHTDNRSTEIAKISGNRTASRNQHPTIISLAKSYRLNYIKMLKELNKTLSSVGEKRPLDAPTATNTSKRQRASAYHDYALHIQRNQIQNENNEEFYFNDERRM